MMDIAEWLRAYASRKTLIDLNRFEEAAAEIERLRAALKHYASADNWMHIPGEKYERVWLEPDSYTRDAYDGFDIARAALEDKQ